VTDPAPTGITYADDELAGSKFVQHLDGRWHRIGTALAATAVLRAFTEAGLVVVRDATPDGSGGLDQVRRRDTIARTLAKIRAAAVAGGGETAVLRLRGDEITLLSDLADALREIAGDPASADQTARAALGWAT
jgi:hypothetical protein